VAERARPAVARAGALSLAALALLGLTRLIHGALVSHSTDPDTYALVGTLIACAMVAGLCLPAGLASAAVKFISYQQGRADAATARGIYRRLELVGLAGSAALALVTAGLANLALGLTTGETASVALLTAAYSLYSVEKGALYGFGRVATYARLELVCSSLAIAATIVVVASGASAYLLPLALGYAALVAGGRLALRGNGAAAPPPAERREIAGYVAWSSLGILAGAGFLFGLPVLSNALVDDLEVAYVVAATTVVAPLAFLPRALGMALFPAMSQARGAGDPDTVRRHADLATRLLFVVLAPLFALCILLAREILIVFGGEQYGGGAPVLQLLLPATYLAVAPVAAVNALASGSPAEVRVPVTAGVAGTIVGVLAAVALAGPLDAEGICLAYLVNIAITSGVPLRRVWRHYGMAWRGPLLRALVVVVGAFAAARAVAALDLAGAERVAADVGAAVAAAAIAAALLGRDISAVVRAVRGGPPAADAWGRPALEGA
jgi:O-antigen/teichoic acid export membrane protein